jgi:hypothetical protein
MTMFSPGGKSMQPKLSATELIDGAKTLLSKMTAEHLVIAVAMTLTIASWLWPETSFLASLAVLATLTLYVWSSRKAFRNLASLVPIDPETKFFNREDGLRRLAAETTRAVDAGRPLFVSIVDLTLGAGSVAPDPSETQRVVASAAGLLRQQIRTYDLAVRTGPTTFLVIVPEGTSNGGSQGRIKKLAKEVRLPSNVGPINLVLRVDSLKQGDDANTFFTRVEGHLNSDSIQPAKA